MGNFKKNAGWTDMSECAKGSKKLVIAAKIRGTRICIAATRRLMERSVIISSIASEVTKKRPFCFVGLDGKAHHCHPGTLIRRDCGSG